MWIYVCVCVRFLQAMARQAEIEFEGEPVGQGSFWGYVTQRDGRHTTHTRAPFLLSLCVCVWLCLAVCS